MSIYSLLNQDAKRWWYHAQLRQFGQTTKARELERKSILGSVETLKTAVFATVGRGGWTIHHVSKYGGIDHLASLQGYGGIDEPMIQACILAGIPVCDSTTISDNYIYTVVSFPMAAHPDATNLQSQPVNNGKYGSYAYVDFRIVFDLYKSLGATLYNL